MKTQTIEVEGLPEGFKLNDIYIPAHMTAQINADTLGSTFCIVITIEKIQPRRIVLEETDRYNTLYASGNYETQVFNNGCRLFNNPKIWREVKDTNK